MSDPEVVSDEIEGYLTIEGFKFEVAVDEAAEVIVPLLPRE